MKRLILRKGNANVALDVNDVVYIYRENVAVIAVNQNGQKLLCSSNLTELEARLNKDIFFRANRKYLINVNFVKSFRSFERVKLSVTLAIATDDKIVVSQEKARLFKKWIYEEA